MKKIMSAALVLIMTLSLVMVGVPAAWADAPTEEGKVFAGYYTDDTYTTPSNGETSYPKFVDEDVLKVKCQLTYLANEDDDSTRIRVVTTVDSTRYQKVGFFVSVDGGAEKEYATTKVARRIVGTDGLANLEYEPSVFSAESQYFCAYNFTVGSAKFGTALSFIPFWVTMDGTEVRGEERTIKINECESFNNYMISSAADLTAFATASQSRNFANWKVKLTKDIDLNEGWTASATAPTQTWTPIGSTSIPFAGTFDGQGHTISGVYVNATAQFAGLFAKTAATATLKDFRLENSYLTSNAGRLGGIAGSFAGTAEKIYSNAYVNAAAANVYGGFFGILDGSATISECWFDGTVNAPSRSYVGGFIGDMDAASAVLVIEHSLFSGYVEAGGGNYSSTFVGFTFSGASATIRDCASMGKFSASNDRGLFVGRNNVALALENCICANEYSTKNHVGSEASGSSITKTASDYYSSKKPSELYGMNGLALNQWLVFDNYWAIKDGSVPIPAYFSEDGAASYTITTGAELIKFAQTSNSNTFAGWTIKLGADIDLNEGWTAGATAPATKWNAKIGTDSYPFAGTFDGQGHTVRGVYQSASGANAGFFGVTSATAVVENFRLENSYFVSSNNRLGSIIGNGNGVLRNVYSNASVTAKGWVGGLVGFATGVTVENCWFDGTVTTTSPTTQGTGGIIAIAYGGANAVRNCYNSGTINVEQYTAENNCPRVAGIVGYVTQEGTTMAIDGCLNTGAIVMSGSHTDGFGRVLGYLSSTASGTVSNSYGTNESCTGIEGNNHMGSVTITLVAAADIQGSAAQTNMPLLDWTNSWITRDGQFPALKLVNGGMD
ncbi:MAG: hypothetical protein IJU18_06690 [Oscillospiraceae bacterium]|nr:hypothetical protein [Oscillospiraceae bacterium]